VTVIAWDSTNSKCVLTKQFLKSANPSCRDVTPPDLGSFLVKHMLFDVLRSDGKAGAYLLASDGASSAVWYTADVGAGIPSWTRGALVSGSFTILRLTKTPGSVLIYGQSDSTTTVNYDFALSSGGWTALVNDDGFPLATYSSGVGWTTVDHNRPAGQSAFRSATIERTFASLTLTAFSATYDLFSPTVFYGTSTDPGSSLIADSTGLVYSAWPQSSGAGQSMSWTGSSGVSRLQIDVKASIDTTPGPPPPSQYAGSAVITAASVTLTGTGNAIVALSTDHGATFAAPVTVGTAPAIPGGMDTQNGGTVSYAAAANQVKKATTLGGAYSNSGAAIATSTPFMIIPYYQWGSDTTKNTGSSPHYLLGLSALVGGVSLYRDDGTGSRTDITPSITGTKGLFNSPNFATGWKGKRWAIVATFSGTPHLLTTTNISAAGGGWTDRGAIAGAGFAIIPRRAPRAGQLYVNKAGGKISYSRDFGATLSDKQMALSVCSGLDVLS
jgi:hypothetical protein